MKNARTKAGAVQLGGEQHPYSITRIKKPLLKASETAKFRLAVFLAAMGRLVP